MREPLAQSPLLTVLSSDRSSASDAAMCSFACFLGLRAEIILTDPVGRHAVSQAGDILALSRATLETIYREEEMRQILGKAAFVFVYDISPADAPMPDLQWLSSGKITGVSVSANSATQFHVAADGATHAFPVRGIAFSADAGPVPVFTLARTDARLECLITAGEQPHFVSLKAGLASIFLLAGPGPVDLDSPLPPDTSLRPWYARLIAMSIFLRTAFGRACWTSPLTPANFIADDPWLKKRYGFVEYESLLRDVDRNQSSFTIAFIPYNHRRSDPRTIELLRRHSDRFSIAVHGCDHTGGEFASLDEKWMNETAACALDRMEDHERRTGMPFDHIMVFPQGRFSTKGIRALKACGYTAAVNSDAWPADPEVSPLAIRDLLQPAVTRFDGFPMFLRRYPTEISDMAFDALFQKPLLAVEHHQYFKDGNAAFNEFVRSVSNLNTTLSWMPLGRAIESSCVLREAGRNRFVVRHLTSSLVLHNPTTENWILFFEKPEVGTDVERVLVNGRETPFALASGMLAYEATLPAGQRLEVAVARRPAARPTRHATLKFRMAVKGRRILSDFRDNQLARSPRLLALAEKMKKILR